MRTVVLTACLLILLVPGSAARDEYMGSFPISDSLESGLYLLRDDAGLPEGYFARITSPVCETGRCYIIELDLYWDLAGNFSAFDTLPGKGLTKLDHIPLEPSDYLKLRNLLQDAQSVLGLYSHDELVSSTRSSGIDGITGATIAGVKESVIDGAVYSCHTLWNIVHGPVGDSIRKHSRQLLDSALVAHLFTQKDELIHRFLLENISDADYVRYLPFILKSMEEGEAYYPKYLAEKMPSYVMADPRMQEMLIREFNSMDYFTQVAILEKISKESISDDFRKILIDSYSGRNTYRDELIGKLIGELIE